MNELTTDLETEAGGRARLLRQVQTAGIALALLNFVFIVFKFVRRLRLSDARGPVPADAAVPSRHAGFEFHRHHVRPRRSTGR
jgi:hypothetical protein